MKTSVDDLVLQAERWRCTQLGIGVVSRNVVDVTVDVAKRHRLTLMLVASRRQIDSASLGGGYVCGWTSHDLAEHVSSRGGAEWILLARDHGGPWQHTSEVEGAYDEDAAMRSAMASYREDIDAGFSIIHIDPSTSLEGEPAEDVILSRMLRLYEDCGAYERAPGRASSRIARSSSRSSSSTGRCGSRSKTTPAQCNERKSGQGSCTTYCRGDATG
jgi:tagatose-1,6-bisphosphate aldolase non-catalytic subunit AgaZ/GatZ